MRLPLIKHIVQFIKTKDEDYVYEVIKFLEDLTECESIKDDELNVIGEILSNSYGALEVKGSMNQGNSEKAAMNEFMKRVMGSIDR